ncbi:hypothetical protein ZIOFF_048035 [Zingiber officinale]|uniref:Uncharacterized protein n=1 Tax=Zingiber officinale TaxID=94328 RepID=A0A8J5FQ25_ZINOF|nr:hypothetical protein ZIOFF_048035 [Zingiber officinale]
MLTPFAIVVEGPKVWAAGWQKAISEIGPQLVCSRLDSVLRKVLPSPQTGLGYSKLLNVAVHLVLFAYITCCNHIKVAEVPLGPVIGIINVALSVVKELSWSVSDLVNDLFNFSSGYT